MIKQLPVCTCSSQALSLDEKPVLLCPSLELLACMGGHRRARWLHRHSSWLSPCHLDDSAAILWGQRWGGCRGR